jgi:hypothetical protein
MRIFHYPKRVRLVVLVNGQGTTKCLTASDFRLRGRDEACRGFHPLATFTVPLRRLVPADGWARYYFYFVRWATAHMGI